MSCESNLTDTNVNIDTSEMETDSVHLIPTVKSEDVDSNQKLGSEREEGMSSLEPNELSPKPTNVLSYCSDVDIPKDDVSPQQSPLPSADQVFATIQTKDPEEKLGLVTCGNETPSDSVVDRNIEPSSEELVGLVEENQEKPIEMSEIGENKKNPFESTMTSDLLNIDADSENAMICDENEVALIENEKAFELGKDDQKLTAPEEALKTELLIDAENKPANNIGGISLIPPQGNEVESTAIGDQNENDPPRSPQSNKVESTVIRDQNTNDPLPSMLTDELEVISDQDKGDSGVSLKTLEFQETLRDESKVIGDQNKGDPSENFKTFELQENLRDESKVIGDQNKGDPSESLKTLELQENLRDESKVIGDQNKSDPGESLKTLELQESDNKPLPVTSELQDNKNELGLLDISPSKTSDDNIVPNAKENPILMAQLLKGNDHSPYIPGKMSPPKRDPSYQMKIPPSMTGLLTGDGNKPSQPETRREDESRDSESDKQIFLEKPETVLPVSEKNNEETNFVPSMTGLLASDANESHEVESFEMINLQEGNEKPDTTPPEPMEEDQNDPSDYMIAQSKGENPIMMELRKGDEHKHALGEKLSLPGFGLPKAVKDEEIPTVPSLTLGLFSGDGLKQPLQTENPIMAELRKSDHKKHLSTAPSLTLGLLAGNESSEGDQNKQNEPELTLGLLTGEECNQLLSEQSITLGLLSNDKSKPLSTEPNSAMESSDCSPNRSELMPPVTCFEEDTRSSWNFDASKTTGTSLKELPRNIDENAQTSMHVPAKETLLAVKPMDEDSRISVGSQKSTKRRLSDDEGSLFPAERLFEYQWPAGKGEFYLLQEHVSEFLGVKSFKRKYPEFGRRPVDVDERRFLKDCGVVSETQCDLGLTAVRSDDVLELMSKDYPDRYQEYLQVLQERERQKISNKHKEYATALVDKTKINDFLKKAINSAAEYNAHLNQERREERKTSFDLQTYTVHIPAAKIKKLDKEATKVGSYPVSLLTGQFQDSYRVYNSEEMKYFPMNTVLYGPLKELGSIYAQPSSDGSQSDSEDSCASGSCCSSSQGTQDGSVDSSSSSEQPRPTKSRSDYVGDVPYKPKDKPNAQCKVCHSNSERNKEGRPEDLVHCSECESSGHPSCLELTAEMVAMVKSYPWQCMDCKTCMLCMDPYDEDKMMFCDKCDRGYHTFCVGLKAIPSGRWICQLCGQCASCGSRTPGPEGSKVQWHQEILRSGTPNGEPVKQLFCANCAKQRKYR